MTIIQGPAEVFDPRTSSSGIDPVWMLNVHDQLRLVRRITVLAPTSEAALLKGREQLDDGEILSFCFTNPASEYSGRPHTSGVYQPR